MIRKNKSKFKCVSEQQKKAIRISYAKRQQKDETYQISNNDDLTLNNTTSQSNVGDVQKENKSYRNIFPIKFPFWARLKINKNRTTLVIDEEEVKDKKNNLVPGFVHREAIHVRDNDPKKLKNYECIFPNPDTDDKDPMYLKRPAKLPQILFKLHNKNLNMPQYLIDKYDKNNCKNKK